MNLCIKVGLMNSKASEKIILNFIMIFICLIISFFVALRPEGLTADYDIYYIMYNYPEIRSGEIVFQFFRWMFIDLEDGFIFLLFVHCFLALILKFIFLKKVEPLNAVLFIMFYFPTFFILWEMTQIRIGLAISFYLFSLFFFKGFLKYVSVIFTLLIHASMIFLIVPFILFNLFKKRSSYVILAIIPVAIICKILILFTGYSDYEASSYEAYYNIFSLKNAMIIFLTTWCIKANKEEDEFISLNTCIALSLVVFSMILGSDFPGVAVRLTDIAAFFSLMTFTFLRNTKENFLLKILVLTVVTVYYSYRIYLSEKAIFNLEIFHSIIYSFF